jgi:hypothetical protein
VFLDEIGDPAHAGLPLRFLETGRFKVALTG